MKAISILSPGVMELVDVPTPKPGRDDVLLRVERVGFCGSDLNSFRGINPLVNYPRIPGHEIQARIVSIGENRNGSLREGQSVAVVPYTACGECPACSHGRPNACRFNQTLGVQRDGGLCEYLCVPADRVVADSQLGDAALALVEPLSVSAHAVERGKVADGEVALVLGCGMIGLGVIASAAHRGARVVGVDIDDAKLELAREAGAAHVINSATESLDSRLSELTAGNGPDVAFEAVGHPQTFGACIEHVRYAGRVVFVGYAKDAVPFATKWFILKELDMLGSRNATLADFDRVMKMLRRGTFPVDSVISKTVSLEDAAEAMREWDRNPSLLTKIHVRIGAA